MPNSTSDLREISIAPKTRHPLYLNTHTNIHAQPTYETTRHSWLHISLPMMKSILASLVSFFLAATFSDSASCLHVSAAEVHSPNSAITIDGITVRANEPDVSVEISPSIHKSNITSPNDT